MQTGQSDAINAKDRATNSRRIFSLRTHPIHTMGHKTHVLLHFVLFECIWDRFVTALNSVQNEPNWGNEWKVCATKSRWNFSLWTHPIHTKGPKTHVLLHFVLFGCIWECFVTALNSMQMGQSITIIGKVRVKKSHSNLPLRTRLIHTIGP